MLHYKQQGYGLIVLLLVLIAAAGSALTAKIYQQSKQKQRQDELIVETLHQTRMATMRYYQQNGHWPAQPIPDLAVSYVESLTLVAGSEPALRIKLFSQNRVERVQPYLAASWVSGDELWLRLLTEPVANAANRPDDQSDWVNRADNGTGIENTSFETMNTALDMAGFDLNGLQQLDSEQLNVNEINLSLIHI